MTCSEYVERFSDIHDGMASEETIRAGEEHLAACPRCRRYRDVLEEGARLLRSLPAPEVREDFVPRLQHRLYHVEEEALLRRHTHSGATAMAVAGMALLLVAVAWAPALRPGVPVVDLPPIVVDDPPASARSRSVASFTAFAVRTTPAPVQASLWGDARTVLFEYSRLAQRYGQRPSPGRSGLDQP